MFILNVGCVLGSPRPFAYPLLKLWSSNSTPLGPLAQMTDW